MMRSTFINLVTAGLIAARRDVAQRDALSARRHPSTPQQVRHVAAGGEHAAVAGVEDGKGWLSRDRYPGRDITMTNRSITRMASGSGGCAPWMST